jgi:CheY-like chemotaxis protein
MAGSSEDNGTPASFAVILLVEDDPEFAEALGRVLRAAGHEVILASDHRLALETLESKQTIDVLLTDLVMPGRVNGMALARMARLRRPRIGIVYMTAYDIPGAAQEAMGPILMKPIDNALLLDEIGRVFKNPTGK